MPRNLLLIPTQVLPAGSTQAPGAHGGLAAQDQVQGGQGMSPQVAFGAPRWPLGLAAVATSPCIRSSAAALLPQQRSGPRCSIPQHPRAWAGIQGTAQPPVPPTQPCTPAEQPWLCPHNLPTAPAAPRLSLPFSREKGVPTQQPVLPQAHPATRAGVSQHMEGFINHRSYELV